MDSSPKRIQATVKLFNEVGVKTDSALDGITAINLVHKRFDQVYLGEVKMYRLILLAHSLPD